MCYLLDIISSEAVPPYFHSYLGEPDIRVKQWFLLNSPFNLVIIYMLYGMFVYKGRKFMKKQKPFILRKALIVYNSFQIVYSVYLCKEIFLTAYLSGYKVPCTPLDTSNSELALRMTRAFWYFYVSKIIDLGDTIFFVLRKKTAQLTFLHIYHHSSMVFNWYVGVLYTPGGQAFFSAGINSFVHVIMYTYYLLSALGPKMQKYLWWKKYITQIQLIQFIVVMVHLIVGLKNGCDKPLWLVYFTIIYLWTLVLLFANFYIRTYNKTKLSNRFTPPNKKSILNRAADMKSD